VVGSANAGPDARQRHHPEASKDSDRTRHVTARRLAMVAATAFLTINIWTGAPLAALWIGSQASNQRVLSMGAVAVVLLVLAVLVVLIALALTWLSNSYDELIGRPPGEHRATWLRSMRAEERTHVASKVGVTALERVVMASVYIAVLALIVWLAFFAGSMVPSGLRG